MTGKGVFMVGIKLVIPCPILRKMKGTRHRRLFPHFFIIGKNRKTLIKEAVLRCSQCLFCKEIGQKVTKWIEDKKVSKQDKILFRIVKEYKKKFGLENKKIILVENGIAGYRVHGVLEPKDGFVIESRISKAMVGASINKPNDEVIVI